MAAFTITGRAANKGGSAGGAASVTRCDQRSRSTQDSERMTMNAGRLDQDSPNESGQCNA